MHTLTLGSQQVIKMHMIFWETAIVGHAVVLDFHAVLLQSGGRAGRNGGDYDLKR